ncbi:MAG: hypothetical protein HYV39_00485 [Candidatus Levybacteria bacterium]|nr:hypothetical protein [Candidatus Levybacteria bacterium]
MENNVTEVLSPQKIRFGVQFLAVGAYLVYVSLSALKLYRFTKILPLSKTRAIAIGPVHLVGSLVSDYELTGPVSGKKGLLVITEIDVWKPGIGKGWTSVLYKGNWKDLYIQDESGAVEVDPKMFLVHLKPVFAYKSWSKNKITESGSLFLHKIGFKTHVNLLGVQFPKYYRVREYVVEKKESMEVFGYASLNPDTKRLVVSNTKNDHFILQEKGYNELPYRSLISLSLGSVLLGLGITVSVFSIGGIASPQALVLWFGVLIMILLISLKHYKII